MLPLGRFEEAGADMTEITMPFGLATEGTLALTFSKVQLVCGPETEVVCPPE